MRILGLHTIYHDTGACLIDGKRVVAISEERLNREKHSGKFPELSIAYCLKEFGLKDINDVDIVAVDHLKDKRGQIEESIRAFGFRGEIFSVDHHDAHAANAFFCSPFEDAAVMVIDGEGSSMHAASSDRPVSQHASSFEKARELQSFYRGGAEKLHLIKRTYSTEKHRHGIGNFYSGVSRFLNFGEFGAGKVMGLAPYGNAGKKGEWEQIHFEHYNGDVVFPTGVKLRGDANLKKFGKQFLGTGKMRNNEPLPDDLYTNIAYLCQHNCEQALITVARWLHDATQCKNLTISGGVGLNSVSNQKILDETPFERIFIQPACSDAGIPLGCALYVWHQIKGNPRFYEMKHAYMGREYSDEEIRDALRKKEADIRVEKCPDIAARTAKLLAERKIIGWFQGRSEAGPRALGHRSIICDPRPADAKDILNLRVKHREAFRPFAPSVLSERAKDYFHLQGDSPFMLLIAKVREEKADHVPAITHVDGTARVQTVTPRNNDRYYDLIKAFDELTGVPVILNTSFNVAGEPIVETPLDALNCFLGTAIDHLILNDYLVSKA